MAVGWRWRRATLWAAVAVVVGLALAIGAGAFSSGSSKPVSLYQRTLEVAGQYRCPVCASESAAVSDASEAVQIRSLIEGWLKKGDTQAQIRQLPGQRLRDVDPGETTGHRAQYPRVGAPRSGRRPRCGRARFRLCSLATG